MNPASSTELLALLRTRRSVRHFLPEPVPEELLKSILEAATWAPSAHNRQPWRFVVLQTRESRSRLAEQMGAQFHRDLSAAGLKAEEVETRVRLSEQRILTAPVAVLLCMDASSADNYPDPAHQNAEQVMYVQSVALAGGNLLLAAHTLGLAGVWMCAPLFAPEAARLALELPDDWQPQALILFGFPARPSPERGRMSVEEVSIFL
jgi:coenzyme F420-0:L-glutamate ligase/coenzyme F420-1:gamma-L-glutamate ligase